MICHKDGLICIHLASKCLQQPWASEVEELTFILALPSRARVRVLGVPERKNAITASEALLCSVFPLELDTFLGVFCLHRMHFTLWGDA